LEQSAINTLSLIVPVFNEAAVIQRLLASVALLIEKADINIELILVDGGSSDSTKSLAEQALNSTSLDWRIVDSPAGRAKQMNAGADMAKGDALLFLHADTELPNGAFSEIKKAAIGHHWGRFDVEFIESDKRMKIVAAMMNWRSRQFAIATGDQAIFVTKKLFELVGGFDDIALMEDVALSKKLKAKSGWLKTVLLMWYLRFAYFIGISAQTLAKQYRQVR